MAVLYSIRDWDKTFEVAQSRVIKGPHTWVAMPTKHDGKSYRRIMLRDDGHVIYGAWVLIVQVAAKCPTRGILADSDGPLDENDLAVKTTGNASVFLKALNVLSSKEIGWIDATQLIAGYEPPISALCTQDRTGQDRTDTSCGDDATAKDGTASANGSEDGGSATSRANGQGFPEPFEEFWLAYPARGGRKRGKSKCLGIWRQAIRAAERQPLVEAARNYAASDDATRGFAKDPERFLRAEWWRDWVPSLPVQTARPPPAATAEVQRRIAPADFTK